MNNPWEAIARSAVWIRVDPTIRRRAPSRRWSTPGSQRLLPRIRRSSGLSSTTVRKTAMRPRDSRCLNRPKPGHRPCSGALWVACRSTDIGFDVEKRVREVLDADGAAHLLISVTGTRGLAQLQVRMAPVYAPH